MPIIAQSENVTVAGVATLYTAATSGTVNIRVLNAGDDMTEGRVYLTKTPASPVDADLVDMVKLQKGQALLLTGEPIEAGESVVINSSGTTVNLACRVNGFMEA